MGNKQKQNMRKWRLIVRNVSFSCCEDDIRKAFYKHGEIFEIDMPKKKGHFAGFCFVQYKTYDQAAQAMKAINGREISGRVVAVDWAMPKDQYMTAVIEEKRQNTLANAQKSSADEKLLNKDKVASTKSRAKASADDSASDDQAGSSNGSNDDESADRVVDEQKVRQRNDDVQEGRTVFIRGIPFEADEGELKLAFEKFGSLDYAVICKFHDSDHSKGSGFVKFVKKSSADASVKDQDILIRGRKLTVCPAVSRQEAIVISVRKSEQNKEPTDKRNLHLLRVGLIRAGTHEAAGMSDGDVAKRLKIESSNRRKIKNLNIFVSPTRLVVHNLPTHLSDEQLKSLCLSVVDDREAVVKECRIMRDFDRTNSAGLGRSRGYAFVEFNSHSGALQCVKKLNNNPEVFTDKKRPIVEFSLENRLALDAKAKRLEKSKIGLKRPCEKDSLSRDLTKRRKMLFKPTIVPAAPGGPKKPFPSHMGPKIRARNNTTANKVGRDKSDHGPRPCKSGKTRRNSGKVDAMKKKRLL